MQITEPQRRALQLIREYPFRVIARPRTEPGYLQINARTESALIRKGLIRTVEFGRTTIATDNGSAPVEVYVWELTEAGRALVIGSGEIEQAAPVEVEPVDVLIDREGLDAGKALIYCRADARMDGRLGDLGHDDGKIYIETYGLDRDGRETGESVTVSASSAERAVRKLARLLGVTLGTITTDY